MQDFVRVISHWTRSPVLVAGFVKTRRGFTLSEAGVHGSNPCGLIKTFINEKNMDKI